MRSVERALLVFSWAIFIIFLAYRIMVVLYPQPDAGGVEGNVIYFIQRILDGQPLYSDPELPPYAIAQYTPLYYYLVASISWSLGMQADDVQQLFITSRVTGLVLNLLFALLVYILSRRIFALPTGKSIVAAILSFIFLEITSYSRPDSLYHVLFMGAVIIFFRLVTSTNTRVLYWLLFWFSAVAVITLFAKQSAILLPLLAGLYFVVARKFNLLFRLIAWYFLMAGTIFAVIYLTSDFSLFYMNNVKGIDNGISAGWFEMVIIRDFYLSFGLFFVPVALILFVLLRKEKESFLRATAFLLAFLFLGNNLLAIKNGSNPGYFTEWWTLVIVLFMYCWSKLWVNNGRINNIIPALCLFILMGLKTATLIKPVSNMTTNFYAAQEQFEQEKEIALQLAGKIVQDRPYRVFLNYNTAESYFSNLLFRHAVMPQMDIVGLSTFKRKKFDYSDFTRRLRSGEFTWMIMRPSGPQKQFFDIKLDNYRIVNRKAGYNFYQINLTDN